jgi:hypothetical protein
MGSGRAWVRLFKGKSDIFLLEYIIDAPKIGLSEKL